MAGIYIHIPFCKQACFYCDFHFSTSLKKKEEMLAALVSEIEMRKNELANEAIGTIYFGGGTPSLLSTNEITQLIQAVYNNFEVVEHPEITLEANPDDLAEKRLQSISKSPVNRLSIGIQSFFDEDLKLMNRAHNSEEAKQSLSMATKYFDNISLDLIYGIPGMSHERWKQNITIALNFGISHISSYALTVEPKTALEKLIKNGLVEAPKDAIAKAQFHILIDTLEAAGFIHYELSNFGKDGFFSQNNSAYWQGKQYLGVGPSAHSFNGKVRGWNISNNTLYIKSIQSGKLPSETERLTTTDRYNEYVMTGLRTIWGVSFKTVEQEFGHHYLKYLNMQAEKYVSEKLLYIEHDVLKTTKTGKFLADGIAADLFKLNLL